MDDVANGLRSASLRSIIRSSWSLCVPAAPPRIHLLRANICIHTMVAVPVSGPERMRRALRPRERSGQLARNG